MENTVEVRYAGVVVGRSAIVRDRDENGAFVSIAEPLPVGTAVTLTSGDATEQARVVEVVESADPSASGIRVRFGGPVPSAVDHQGTDESGMEETSGPVSEPPAAGDSGTQPGGGGRRRRRRR